MQAELAPQHRQQVFFVTAAAFGGLGLFGYTTKKDLSGWGSFLIMGVIGIVIASLVNLFLQLLGAFESSAGRTRSRRRPPPPLGCGHRAVELHFMRHFSVDARRRARVVLLLVRVARRRHVECPWSHLFFLQRRPVTAPFPIPRRAAISEQVNP
jgi:hypothetical protein